MKRLLQLIGVVLLVLSIPLSALALSIALVGCEGIAIPNTPGGVIDAGADSISDGADNAQADIIPANAEVWGYFGRTDNPLPSYADTDAEAPFADVKDSDIVSVEALYPLVASAELTAEEQQTFANALRGMTLEMPPESRVGLDEVEAPWDVYNEEGYRSYGMGNGGALWFDVGFADGSTWLMHLKSCGMLGHEDEGVLYAGGVEYKLPADTYKAFAEVFSACGQRVKETAPAEARPFADLTREDVVSADYNHETAWIAMDDDEIDEFVEVLQAITVDPSSATNTPTGLYGSNGPDQLRIVCADGSSHIVGVYGGIYIDGLLYQGSAEGLADFIRY